MLVGGVYVNALLWVIGPRRLTSTVTISFISAFIRSRRLSSNFVRPAMRFCFGKARISNPGYHTNWLGSVMVLSHSFSEHRTVLLSQARFLKQVLNLGETSLEGL